MLVNLFSSLFSGTRDKTSPEYVLERSKLFGHLQKDEFAAVSERAEVVSFESGQTIVQEGDLGDDCYVIVRGDVRVSTIGPGGDVIVLARLGPYAFFGEQALLEAEPRPRNSTVTTATDVEVLRVGHDALTEALESQHKLRANLEIEGQRQLVEKLSHQVKIFGNVKGKLITQLANNVRRFVDGDVIFRAGDVADGAYYLTAGGVKIHIDDSEDAEVSVGAGQLFGELGVVQNQTRAGTAVADGAVQALFFEKKAFQKLTQQTPELKECLTSLQRIYKIPRRGVIALHSGSFAGMDAVTSLCELDDGASWVASKVVDREIFSLTKTDAVAETHLTFEEKKIKRELHLKGNVVVGILSYGYWSELGAACAQAFDQQPVEGWQESLFSQAGRLEVKEQVQTYSPTDVLCNCMRVDYGTIVAAIKNGSESVDALQDSTGASTVCGSCRSKLAPLLGHSDWIPVTVAEVITQGEDIHTYRLKPYRDEIQPYSPGQHVVVQTLIDNNCVERTYTLTSTADNREYYEITVKREPRGFFSRWLCEHKDTNPFIRISPPTGTIVTEFAKAEALVCFVAGIGITPSIALARHLSQESGPVFHVDYSVHAQGRGAFEAELAQIADVHPHITVNIRMTGRQGRITAQEVAEIASARPTANFYVCGPEPFESAVSAALQDAQVAQERIFHETFTHAGHAAL